MAKPPLLRSFLGARCPQCRDGKIFKYSIFNITKFKQAYERCPTCNVKFESEPGFFWGAMYFSYALNVGIAIVTGIVFFNVYEDPPLGPMILTVLGMSVVFSPLIFRLARLLMMYIAAPYRRYKGIPKKEDLKKESEFSDL